MTSKRVLKFPVNDNESSFVLVQVSPKGSKPLDLKLVGTEGEAPYVCSLRHDRVASLRVKNCSVSEEEWQTILQSIFDQQPLPDIQASASVQSESSISLTIRKQVQGITQRLGAITLNHDADEAIELFDWCATSVDAVTKAKASSSESASQVDELRSSVEELKAQLDELVAAKQEDEVVLLQKFRDLLNEKKVKIREQQKIITEFSANAPPEKDAEEMDGVERPATTGRKKPPKRKAKAVDESPVEDEDVAIKEERDDSDAGNTTEVTASVASDDEDDEDEDMGGPQGESTKEAPPPKKQDAPPPPRALPFQRKKPAVTNDSDSDDEL
ncbi:DNA double-strand break repair and VJ recombination XRCC4 [Pochonia chlamydosporia 170]|uniref:DNA double-strand break repair and VJ recombination XRCC4 n=1 Tax=Pochonia chlamydosporia 170 TaxID=1380566 RepID=A0A179G769_METCM|nr:DNA double-strand break repair and VJ recombination XRCC4 [Pochonia chlamydosporia 170]OAQ73019.1 DNA double-strand break repair and VJ recombination XRCC4 [Pochonia chlamydosporia 170]